MMLCSKPFSTIMRVACPMKLKSTILFVALLASGFINAGTELDKQAYQISAFNGNIAEQANVAKAKITQIEYVELTAEDRKTLTAELDRLASGVLSADQQHNSQNQVNAILAKSFRDSKLICTYETPLGSNMKKRVCVTAAAKKRVYEKTQKDLINHQVSDVQRVN
jgi:hypothetical protein